MEIQVPNTRFISAIHYWQRDVFSKFDAGKYRFFLLNWHRRARKTSLILNMLIKEACRNPKKVYGYIAPTYTQGKSIAWRTPEMLDAFLPTEMIERKNESELFVEFKNKAILMIKGADQPDSLRGLDFEGVGIDEWALAKPMIWEEIIRPVITQDPKRWAAFAFTPKGKNHAYDYWVNSTNWDGWYRSHLPVSVSKLLPEDELIKARKEMPESMYQQEFECSFLASDENVLITIEDMEALKGNQVYFEDQIKVIACDPSEGGDECVIYYMENYEIKSELIIHYKDTMKIAGEIAVMARKNSTEHIAVDSIGIGKGIVDRLRELGFKVRPINSAASAIEKDRFYNVRAEMWWRLSTLIKNRSILYPLDEELRRQLSSVRYEVVDSNGKIKLESKHMTKELLDRSPDRADAYVYGVYLTSILTPRKKKETYRILEPVANNGYGWRNG